MLTRPSWSSMILNKVVWSDIYTLITKLSIENVIINVKYVFQGSNKTFLSWISVRRWKIGSNQPDEGGSYCDSHTHACPSAFPDLGEDEDEDGCDNDDDDDGYGDDGDDYTHGRVGPCCMGCRYSSCPPPRQHCLSAPGQISEILIGLNWSDHKLSVFKNIQQCNLSQNWCW